MIRRHHQIYIWEERETFVVNNLLQRNGSTELSRFKFKRNGDKLAQNIISARR